LRIACASGFKAQYFRTCRGVIRPLTCGPRAPNRFDCRARASKTCSRNSAEVGPGGISANWVNGTAGTST
jgi:hypothetical protein